MIDELCEAHKAEKEVIENKYTLYDYHTYKLRKALQSERERDYSEKNKSTQ